MATLDELGDLAESLVPVAEQLVGAVHDDGPAAIGRLFAVVPPGHLPALCVVLAAMVDPDKRASEMLGWVNWEATPHTPTLFDGAQAHPEDPRGWSDSECHQLWKMHRSALKPPHPLQEVRELRGYREWERRRKGRQRRDP